MIWHVPFNASASRPRSRRSGRAALVAGIALVAGGALPGFLAASLAPRIGDDFHFGPTQLGLTVGLFYVVAAVASPPGGRLVDRIPPKRGIEIAAALTVLSCIAAAVLAGSAAGLMALLVPAAVGNALAGPAVSALLRAHVAGEREGLAFGFQQAGAPVGALAAALLVVLARRGASRTALAAP